MNLALGLEDGRDDGVEVGSASGCTPLALPLRVLQIHVRLRQLGLGNAGHECEA